MDSTPEHATRWITEMGMGVDVHGRDYTKAARRAVSDALRHSSLHFFQATDKTRDQMQIEVVIGCADPEAIDAAEVLTEIPYGSARLRAEVGGLDVSGPNGSPDGVTIAVAAILVGFTD